MIPPILPVDPRAAIADELRGALGDTWRALVEILREILAGLAEGVWWSGCVTDREVAW